MTKQFTLPGMPKPERAPLVLNGEPGIDWQVDGSPWPMPTGGKYEPKPRELTLKELWRFELQRKVAA